MEIDMKFRSFINEKNEEIKKDKFTEFYEKIVNKLEKSGWEQIRGDNDPYSSISKKFTRKGLSLIPDVIELDQYNAILNARISGKILKNIELEDLTQLENIIDSRGGFIKKETFTTLQEIFKEFGKVKFKENNTFILSINDDMFNEPGLKKINDKVLVDSPKIGGITWDDAPAWNPEILDGKFIDEILNSGDKELYFSI